MLSVPLSLLHNLDGNFPLSLLRNLDGNLPLSWLCNQLIMMCYCFRCLKVADTCVIACIALQPSRKLIHVLLLSLLCNLHSENVINIVLQCTAFILDNNQHFYCFATLLYSVTVDVAFVTVDVASKPVTPQLMSHKVAIAS